MLVDINNSKMCVWLSSGLLNDLRTKLEEYNKEFSEDKKLTLSVAAYFVNLPNYILSTKKDKYENGWASICSKIIKQIGQYERYMDFLVKNEFLEVNNSYSPDAKYCKKYRLGVKYRKHVSKKIEIKAHPSFCEKRAEYYRERIENAKANTPHLTKWLDKADLIEVDYLAAEEYIKEAYRGSEIEKRNVRQMNIDMIKMKHRQYSREGKDDRLHTLFTSLPRDLRPFVVFDKKPLISLDITASQPFILSSIIYCFMNPLSSTLLSLNYSSSIMFNPIGNSKGINEFIDKVLSGEFYSYFGDKLYKSGLLYSNIEDIYFLEKESAETFNSRREAAKRAIMRILYSSSKNNEAIIRVFNETYPEVGEIIKKLKTKNKSDFPILMQNIEAKFILDYCTKEIALKQPEMPLFTIHDSILTTNDFAEILEEEFYGHLKNYFTICPRLKKEFWSSEFKNNELKKTA